MNNKIGNFYLFLIFCIFPLVFHDYYFDIYETKFYFYIYSTLILFLLLIWNNGMKKQRLGQVCRKKEMLCYMAFLFFAVCSTVFSEHRYQALTGNMGRKNGLLTVAVFCVSFVILMQADKLHWEMFYLLEFSGIFVGILAVLNHYGIDPLGFMAEIGWNDDFMSTIGNVGSVVEFMTVILAVSGIFFILEDDKKKNIFHGIVYAIAMLSMLLAGADSAYGGIVIFYLLAIFAVKSTGEKLRYLLLVAYIVIAFLGIGVLNEQNWHFVVCQKNLSMITRNLGKQRFVLFIALIISAVAGAAICLFSNHPVKVLQHIPLKKIYAAVLAGLAFFLVGIIICVNTGKIVSEPWTMIGKLKINDAWGNNRGYIWRNAWEYYKQLPIGKKLLGIGPDTMYYVFEEMGTIHEGVAIDNAHFLILQMLVTHGLAGAVSWIGWIIGAISLGIRKAGEEKRYFVIVSGIIGYYATAMFGISLISSSAIAMILLELCFCSFAGEEMQGEQKKKWLGYTAIMILFFTLVMGFSIVCQADAKIVINKLWME